MTHYDTLNIQKDATETDIKKAFKKLALKHHPDRGGDKEKFQEIQKAYDTLVNHESREEYDDSLNGRPRSMFDMLFSRRPQSQMRKGADVNYELLIDLEQSFIGATKKIKITRKAICIKCDGVGTPLEDGKKICTSCEGTGTISSLRHMGIMQIMQQQPCHHCNQRGYTIIHERRCHDCSGSGTISRCEELDIPLRKGCHDGEIIVFQGMADELPNIIPGDLLIYIKLKPHSIFTRKQNDLYFTKELNLYEALKGYDFLLKQLDGTNLRIQHSGTTQPETSTPIDGKGMPILDSEHRGKLWITFKVRLPDFVPDAVLDKLNEYK